MTYEAYELALKDATCREVAAKQAIAQEQTTLQDLKEQVVQTDKSIRAVHNEIPGLIGMTQEEITKNGEKEAALIAQAEALAQLPPEEIKKRSAEIQALEKALMAQQSQTSSLLFASSARLSEVEGLIRTAKENAEAAKRAPVVNTFSGSALSVSTYTVQDRPNNRECLWKIAGREEVFNDALQWPKLYQANKSRIDAAFEKYRADTNADKYSRPEDLIFPGQVFNIPR